MLEYPQQPVQNVRIRRPIALEALRALTRAHARQRRQLVELLLIVPAELSRPLDRALRESERIRALLPELDLRPADGPIDSLEFRALTDLARLTTLPTPACLGRGTEIRRPARTRQRQALVPQKLHHRRVQVRVLLARLDEAQQAVCLFCERLRHRQSLLDQRLHPAHLSGPALRQLGLFFAQIHSLRHQLVDHVRHVLREQVSVHILKRHVRHLRDLGLRVRFRGFLVWNLLLFLSIFAIFVSHTAPEPLQLLDRLSAVVQLVLQSYDQRAQALVVARLSREQRVSVEALFA